MASDFQYADFNQLHQVPVGDNPFRNNFDEDRPGLATGTKPVLLMTREGITVTSDRAIIDKYLALFVSLGIDEPHSSALRRIDIGCREDLYDKDRRSSLGELL